MSEFIKKVTDNIPDRKLKKEIEEELSCHIEEKAEFYIKRGFSKEDAYKKADEDMGEDAVRVGVSLSEIHPVSRGKMLFFSIIIYLFTALVLFADKYSFVFYLSDSFGITGILVSGIMFIIILSALKYSVKRKSVSVLFALCVLTATRFYYVFQLPFFYCLIGWLSGSAAEYYSSVISRDIMPTKALMLITGVYIAVILVISFLSLMQAFSFYINRFSKNKLVLQKILEVSVRILLIFTVISVIISMPVYFCEPDYEYEYISGVAIIHISDESQAQEILEKLENDAKYIVSTAEKSYYIEHGVDFGSEELYISQYVGGNMVHSYIEKAYIHSASGNLYEPVNYAYYESDEFTQERHMSISVPVSSEDGYLLIVPKTEENDYSERYLINESEIIDLPLEKNYYITGNCYSSYYEIVLKNA